MRNMTDVDEVHGYSVLLQPTGYRFSRYNFRIESCPNNAETIIKKITFSIVVVLESWTIASIADDKNLVTPSHGFCSMNWGNVFWHKNISSCYLGTSSDLTDVTITMLLCTRALRTSRQFQVSFDSKDQRLVLLVYALTLVAPCKIFFTAHTQHCSIATISD